MDPHNNQLVRVRLDEVDDTGKQQLVKTRGRKNEQFGDKQKFVRMMPHGFASNPWKDSQGYMHSIGGNLDQPQIHGLEHPDKRLRNLDEGGSGTYVDQDNWAKFEKNGDKWDFHIKVSGNIIFEVPSGKFVKLGDPNATREVAAIGTLDNDTESNGADALVSNLLTKVVGV